MGELGIAFAGGALKGVGIAQQQTQQRELEKQELKIRQQTIKLQEQSSQIQMQKFLAELGRGISLGKGQRLVNPFTGQEMGGGGSTDMGGLEFQAEQQAVPFDLTKPAERSAFATRAAQVGELTPLEHLQQVKQPMERVPQGAESRFFFQKIKEFMDQGMQEDEALSKATEALVGKGGFREQQAQSSAAGKGLGEQRPDVPVKLKDLMLFGKPVGTTFGQVAGETPATPQMQEEVTQLDNASAILDTIQATADRLITAETGGDALLQAGKLNIASMPGPQMDPVARAYSDQLQQFLGVLSRTLGGERGVLTDRDITRIVRGLPRFSDTRAVKDFKLRTMRNILDTAVQAKMRVITRQAAPQVRQKIEGFLDELEKSGEPSKAKTSPKGGKLKFNPQTGAIE